MAAAPFNTVREIIAMTSMFRLVLRVVLFMFLNHSFILCATNEIAMTQKNNCKITATCDPSLDVCFSAD